MKNNQETCAQTPSSLLNDLQALVAEAEKMISSSHPAPTEEVVGALRVRFDAAQECLTGLYNGARKKVVAGARYTDETIRANPYQSLAIAAGVGLLIGVLAGRRSAK
jgi:ElaB/YqjD/DUF883 family membrane-anchored ribosome-binding protein